MQHCRIFWIFAAFFLATLGQAEESQPHGRIEILEKIESLQLGNTRTLYIYLPPGYDQETQRHYPVLYMHDGQNLFDRRTSSSTIEWRVDETMDEGGRLGLIRKAIVVGIGNTPSRLEEYTPSVDPSTKQGGKAQLYLDFIEGTVAPLIQSRYRALQGPENTMMAGSSLGGLISFHAAWTRSYFIGAAGCFSTSFWWNNEEMARLLKKHKGSVPKVRLYLDGGGKEKAIKPMLKIAKHLRKLGFKPGKDLLVVEDPEGIHMEDAWARRLPRALQFLLGPGA